MISPKAKKVQYDSRYKLKLTFSNDEVRIFDMAPYLEYPVYQHLKDEQIFKLAHIAYGTIVWDDVTDIDPDRLYLESTILEVVS